MWCVCYHPPDQKAEVNLEMHREIREVSKRDKIVIMGNPNSPHMNWVNVCLSQERVTGFFEMLKDCALEQFLMEPNRGQVTLDLLFFNSQDLVRDRNVTESLGNRDHAAISFSLHVGGRVSSKSDTKSLDLQRVDFPQVERS